MLCLELGNRLGLILGSLLLAKSSYILSHLFINFRVNEGIKIFQARHLATLFSRYILEQQSAINNLTDCLVEGNGLPLTVASLAGPLQHLADAVGVVGALMACLPLWADGAVNLDRLVHGLAHRQVGEEGERIVGVTVDFDCHPFKNFHLDAAASVAVEADSIEGILGFHQLIGLGLGDFTGFYPGDQHAGKIHLGCNQGTATGQS